MMHPLENVDYRRIPEMRRAPTLHHHQLTLRQRAGASAYASVGQIDAVGHHPHVQRFVSGQ